jgi:hypothetical protein
MSVNLHNNDNIFTGAFVVVLFNSAFGKNNFLVFKFQLFKLITIQSNYLKNKLFAKAVRKLKLNF